MPLRLVVLVSIALALVGCAMDHGDADSPPAAPTGLEASEVAGGAHLTWADNSDNEDHFMVMRMEEGVDTEYDEISTQTFDSVQYHDGDVTSGSTYMYKIIAMNSAGESESNEVSFTAP